MCFFRRNSNNEKIDDTLSKKDIMLNPSKQYSGSKIKHKAVQR